MLFHQFEIVSILQIEVGSVSTMINRLCYKFSVSTVEARLLLEKMSYQRVNQYPCKRFVLRRIIVPDPKSGLNTFLQVSCTSYLYYILC